RGRRAGPGDSGAEVHLRRAEAGAGGGRLRGAGRARPPPAARPPGAGREGGSDPAARDGAGGAVPVTPRLKSLAGSARGAGKWLPGLAAKRIAGHFCPDAPAHGPPPGRVGQPLQPRRGESETGSPRLWAVSAHQMGRPDTVPAYSLTASSSVPRTRLCL